MTTRQNINVDTLEKFRASLEQNQGSGKLHMEASAVYEGQAGRSKVNIGPFALDDTVIDGPTRQYTFEVGNQREVEDLIGMKGSTDRVDPVELVLASIAACLVNSITVNAARLGIDTAGLEIKVRTTLDPRVLLGLKEPEDHGAGLGGIEYDVKVRGDMSDDDLATIHKLCRYSPVHGMMSEAIAITGDVSRV